MGPLKQGQELRGGAQPRSKLWEQDLRSETPCQGGASQSSTQHPIQFQPPCCLQVRISFLIKICNQTFSFQAQGFQCRSCCHSGGGPFCLQQALHANWLKVAEVTSYDFRAGQTILPVSLLPPPGTITIEKESAVGTVIGVRLPLKVPSDFPCLLTMWSLILFCPGLDRYVPSWSWSWLLCLQQQENENTVCNRLRKKHWSSN